MTDRELNVSEMVAAELTRDRNASVEDLHWLAVRIDPAMEKLSLEEFAARFLSERSAASESSSKPKPKRKPKRTRKAKPKRKSKPRTKSAPRAKAASRAKSAPERAQPAESSDPGRARDVVRQALLTFAAEVAAAEDRHAVVVAMGKVDRHVERVLQGL